MNSTVHVVYGVVSDNSRTSSKSRTFVYHYDDEVSGEVTEAAA